MNIKTLNKFCSFAFPFYVFNVNFDFFFFFFENIFVLPGAAMTN